MSIEINNGIAELVKRGTEARQDHRAPPNYNPQLTVMRGPKYARIVEEAFPGQRSVYCFVDLATGDILKAAGWSRPARGARGSVLALESMQFDAHGGCFYRRR